MGRYRDISIDYGPNAEIMENWNKTPEEEEQEVQNFTGDIPGPESDVVVLVSDEGIEIKE